MNALLTLLNRAASDEDEDGVLFYNKIPDYVKERNMIIMRPGTERTTGRSQCLTGTTSSRT